MTISCLSQKTKTKTDNVMSSETTLHLRSYLEKINRLSYACDVAYRGSGDSKKLNHQHYS